MKSNLMLRKFSVNAVPGTMNQKELRTFFGGKIIYSEDKIYINNDSIQFSQINGTNRNGYQYYNQSTITDVWETTYSENLGDLKLNNQKISLYNQTLNNIDYNTRWIININGSKILKDYLFFKIKEQRVFKVISEKNTYYNDINKSIYEYIEKNVFGRYRLENVDFYVEYYNITEQTIYDDILLQFDPKFSDDVYKSENLTNINVSEYDPYKFDNISILYNQSKPSTKYRFNYYFDLIFTKI